MTILENEQLRVTIRPQGAELTSIFHKSSSIEHLWQADPAVWGWHAPNLFPVVGGCLNNQLLIDGQTYPMERHGFARHTPFDPTEVSDSKAVFTLNASDATRAMFPYEFSFQIAYELTDARLTVTYRIFNQDQKAVFFSVGAHPAFTVPFQQDESYDEYFIEFEKDESLKTHRLSAGGYFTGETEPVETDGNRLPLTKHLFDNDALVFKNLTSRRVTLRSEANDHAVTVDFSEFPYLGLWAKPGAPFVCIEPWLGCADSEGEVVPIERKEAIQHVAPDEVFEAAFTITIA